MHRILSITTITFLCFFAFSLSAQKPQVKSIVHKKYTLNDNNELSLSGQTKKEFNLFNSLSLKEEYSVNKKKELQLEQQQRLSYDPKGRHQNTLQYDGQGILQAETKLYWDEYNNKNKVEQIQYNNGQQTSVAITYLLEYDSDGNKQNEKFFNSNGTQVKGRTWYYNNQKEIYKSFTWLENKKEPRKEIYTNYKRNKSGDLIQSITIEKVNGKEFRKDIRYFSNNYVIEWKTFIEGKLENHFINEYRDSVIIRTTRQNKRKILTLEEAAKEKERLERKKSRTTKPKDADVDIFVTNTEYDAYGNILVSSQSINEKVIMVTQYTYDDYGNRIKTMKVDKEKDTKEEELIEYDDWGNITKEVNKKNDRVIYENHYKYEYFPRE